MKVSFPCLEYNKNFLCFLFACTKGSLVKSGREFAWIFVNPTRVDAKGHFLSNFLPHHGSRIQRRHVLEKTRSPERVFYHLLHRGNSLHFNLSLNSHFLATGFLTERRYGGLDGAKLQRHTPSLCHFLGEVWDESTGKGKAAISTCDGLVSGHYTNCPVICFIILVSCHVYFLLIGFWTRQADSNSTCGVQDPHGGLEETEGQRRRWETRRSARRGRRVRQRSVTTEKWVETLVVADPKMVEYHGSQGVESYVLAVMNIVSGLFRDASIGNAIHIVVVRLILLEEEEEELKITHHADSSLSSFCKWQKGLNMKGDDHPLHHDVAVLLTRKDICTSINKPCETLGLSHVAGMCQPHRSCSINEDTGLPLAFTVAHELGHNFGIQHDGNSNDCEPIGKKPFIMSPQLLYGTLRPSWSRCSRQYITRFLDRGWGWCLDDPPLRNELSQTPMPPGLLYSAAHQCRLQYGPQSLLCDDVDNVCSTLWCTVGSTCHSKMDGAVDGTNCGEGKWCFRGECIPAGHRPEGVNGGWSSWSGWTACSRTCGVGVLSAHRDCDNPVPKYGGRYCLGERRRYRTCNKTPCFSELPSFRDLQCGHFNTMAYKGNFHKWVAVNNRDYACELHCRPLNEHFSEKMLDAVADGTRCSETNTSRDMCINGVCKNVGCDFVIDSNALEDRCGVCQGDGSTCKTVTKTFEKSEGLGYVDIGLIPEGARDIRVEEMAAAGNFLALRSDKPDTYFLNGGWTIQWNGEYKAAGTVFTYERTGHLENLTSPGPTKEPLWIQLLFQETNPGVRYEYTIRQEYSEDNTTVMSDFFWKFGSWTECSASCGAGVQRQIVHCVERTSGIVEEHFCDAIIRPDDEQTICQKEQCPPTWWAGEWQKCSSSCGLSGLTKRTVLCIQAVDLEERQALQHTECKHMAKPESVTSCNTHVPCPADWISGSWADCSLTCGTGVHQRNVTCSWNTGVACDSHRRPPVTSSCHVRDCQVVADNFGREDDWSGSGWTSNQGVNEINSIPEVGHSAPKQTPSTRAQPRAHNELDNVIEAEFPPRHHVDKVDDFYYDYNFINFHEDLAYDVVDTENSDGNTPGTLKPVTATQDKGAAEIPTAASRWFDLSATFPTAVMSQYTDYDKRLRESNSTGQANPRLTNCSFKVTAYPSSQESVTAHSISGHQETSADTLPVIETPLPPNGGPLLPALSKLTHSTWPGSTEELPTRPTLIERTAPDGSPLRTHLEPSSSYGDDNEMNVPLEIPRGKSETQPPEITPATSVSLTQAETMTLPSQGPAGSALSDLSSGSVPGPTKLPIPASNQATAAAYWVVGNWSSCSTSCGLGAIWRRLACSTGIDLDCDPAKRPAPARRCYLRPCSAWRTGEWSKCSASCGGGVTLREVQCFDMRDPRPLRPFHCQAISQRPRTHMPCNVQPCLEWYTSSWGQCSEVCGGGEQQRMVTCPEEGQCDQDLKLAHIQSCNSQPCAQWLTGSWGQCSLLCGGGVQHRLIKCVDTRAEMEDEMDQAQCEPQPMPQSTKKCNLHECESASSGR
uniref:A disintegrin and metalloproteinase with thrombospondin motifs 7-like n=1 Tax=Gadus morhua TaxID=8049 RepID=A0A8C4ZKU9_GADMO